MLLSVAALGRLGAASEVWEDHLEAPPPLCYPFALAPLSLLEPVRVAWVAQVAP
jgi:hypothetical protein